MDITSLLSWFAGVGITTDDRLIRLGQPADGGCDVRSVADVPEGAVLGTVPAAACLSVRTTSAAEVIEAERLGGGLGLVLAVAHEQTLGDKSRWCGLKICCQCVLEPVSD